MPTSARRRRCSALRRRWNWKRGWPSWPSGCPRRRPRTGCPGLATNWWHAGWRSSPPRPRGEHRQMTTESGKQPQAGGPEIGLLEWFWINDRAAVGQAVADMKALGVGQLRFGFSWADFQREDGPAWFDWLLPTLAEAAELLPCFVYTPPSLGEQPYTASPPRDLKAFADFIDVAITRYGQ